MHFLDFFAIVERDLDILNPVSPEKLMLLGEYCELREGATVLDVGSGKGYLLRQWAARWGIRGTGLELNPAFVATAQERAEAEGVADRVSFVEGPARDFAADSRGYDVVTCLGAPFAIGSYAEAVAWMRERLKPDGVLAIGDEFLPSPLPAELMAQENIEVGQYRTLPETQAVLEAEGLEVVSFIEGSKDNWDRYTSSSWQAAHSWARENPNYPDHAEVLKIVAEAKAEHLRYRRQHTSWGIVVARLKL